MISEKVSERDEPPHDKTNKMVTFVPSKDSDQPGH